MRLKPCGASFLESTDLCLEAHKESRVHDTSLEKTLTLNNRDTGEDLDQDC